MNKHIAAICQLIPVIISMLLIGAHFLRSGNLIFVAGCLFVLIGLLVRHPLSARIMQSALFLSTAEWVRTVFVLISIRSNAGLSWTRLALILGGVALISFASIFVFFTKALKERYHL
jgi:hypothetical protein